MFATGADVDGLATGTERVGELRRTLVVCIADAEFAVVSFTPAQDPSVVPDGARVVLSCRQDIRFEFKSTERRHGLVEVEGDVATKVIQGDGWMIVDGDVDLIGERPAAVVGPNGVGDGRGLQHLGRPGYRTGRRVEGKPGRQGRMDAP